MRRPPTIRSLKQQSGIALIMAVMIVTLVVTIAIEMSWRFDLSIARTSNRWQFVQSEKYLDGAIGLAKMGLLADFQDGDKGTDDQPIDHLGEAWNQKWDYPTDHGSLQIKFDDAQGRFNINSMNEPVAQENCSGNPAECYTQSQRRFIRLLQTINLSEDDEPDQYPLYLDEYEARQVADAVIDWMDFNEQFDDVTFVGGAESDYYAQLDPPITIANRPMVSVTELRLVKGVTSLMYEKLLPHVIALPEREAGATGGSGEEGDNGGGSNIIPMNLNTMTFEVFRALGGKDSLQPIPIEQAAFMYENTQAGFDDKGSFAQHSEVQAIWPWQAGSNGRDRNNANDNAEPWDLLQQQGGFDGEDITLNSEHFILTVHAMVGEETYTGRVLLHRSLQDGKVTVLRKTNTNF